MADYYIKEIQDYLECLCEQHTDVAHKVNGRRSFARIFSDEEVAEIANNAGKNIVIVARYSGRAIGQSFEQRMLQNVVLYFASYADSSTTTGIGLATTLSFRIMWDFIARLRKDQDEAGNCDALKDLDLQNIVWDEIPDQPFLDNHYGWELTLPFKSYQPAYDADKWVQQ